LGVLALGVFFCVYFNIFGTVKPNTVPVSNQNINPSASVFSKSQFIKSPLLYISLSLISLITTFILGKKCISNRLGRGIKTKEQGVYKASTRYPGNIKIIQGGLLLAGFVCLLALIIKKHKATQK
jgi:hypothetical protein